MTEQKKQQEARIVAWKEKYFSFDRIIRLGKALIFGLLVFVELVLFVVNRGQKVLGISALWVILPIAAALTLENAIKLWALKNFAYKIVCYVLDILLLLVLTYFTDGSLISILYVIILSEFYLSQEKLSGNIAMGVCSIVSYLLTFIISDVLKNSYVNVSHLLSNVFYDLVVLAMHFFVINFFLFVYRKNKELAKALGELHESNENLRRANEELKTVAALEERQRIAKDIHDTAGHSITTVIMQTEAAKLAVDENPEDAKRKIVAANLQAKHALEELRESVHLLSGMGAKAELKEELLNIIHESTDGTGIAIRSDIQEISLCEAKSRFLCNTLKEGISNGLRHGGATAFYFELKREGNQIEFLLSDNGRGIDEKQFQKGFGLTGMCNRAESLGGSATFESEEDEGFELRVSLPTDGDEQGRKV